MIDTCAEIRYVTLRYRYHVMIDTCAMLRYLMSVTLCYVMLRYGYACLFSWVCRPEYAAVYWARPPWVYSEPRYTRCRPKVNTRRPEVESRVPFLLFPSALELTFLFPFPRRAVERLGRPSSFFPPHPGFCSLRSTKSSFFGRRSKCLIFVSHEQGDYRYCEFWKMLPKKHFSSCFW